MELRTPQQPQLQRPGPIPQSGAQSPTPTLQPQPSYQNGQGSGPTYQQGSSTFAPPSQQGSNPQYLEQSTGQRDFPPTQFQPTSMENGSPNNQIQPTSPGRGVYNNQFQLVTPDIRAFGNEYQPQPGPGRGSYNSPNAGYQAPPTNLYPTVTGEFVPVPSQMVNQPVTSRPSNYNGMNTGNGPASSQMLNQPITPRPSPYNGGNPGNSEQYWENSGQFRGDAGVPAPNQSGNNQFMEAEGQSGWTTSRPGYPNQNGQNGPGSAQMQSTTPPNYVNQQQWNGNGDYGMYEPSGSPQPTTPPQFINQEQWNGGQGPLGSPGPQTQNYDGTATLPYNDQYISSLQSTTFPPQSMQETSYSNGVPIVPIQNQRTSPGTPYSGEQFEQSTPGGSSQFGTTQPPRTNSPEGTFTSTPFQYPVTQNPVTFTPPPNTVSSTLRPYNEEGFSNPADQRIDGVDESDGWTSITPSAGNQGEMIGPAFVAPFVYDKNGQQSQTQGGFQSTQGFMPTTEPPRMTTEGHNNGGSFTSAPSGSTTTARYGQNPEGAFVTPTQPSPLQQNFDTVQPNMRTSPPFGQVNDGIATSQSPYMLSTTTRPPGAGPQYDFQGNMNTVYGNYENWPAISIAPVVVTALLALLL
ncbi:hypothetical protein ANCDUO_05697 [Ancylostoma duodenale]|uniref:Uncharacterized protein n=1 Tax=Ancylostoma duodenale TaxID=51022 RepID=A0A0C2H3I7_9BILA|nr:hypothetical protein ANCDUO_05697 [Ancylostoma duodenale]